MMPEDTPRAAATPPAPPRPTLPLRAWRAAGRLLSRTGRSLAAAGRAGWTGVRSTVVARVNATAAAHPGRLLPPLGLARRLAPRARALAEAEALLTARTRGFSAAAPLFRQVAVPPLAGKPRGTAAALLRPPSPGPLRLAIPLGVRPSFVAAAEAGEVVVVTAAFGRPPALPPVSGLAGRIRFLCFTAGPASAPGWTILPPAAGSPDPAADPAAATAFHKIRLGEVLAEAAPGARASLWLDPDRQLVGNLDTLLARWLLPQDLALWRHEDGHWRAMAERHLVEARVPAAAILAQAADFEAAGVPRTEGGGDTGMVWRRHDAAGVAALCDAWWAAWAATPGADDLALYRALAEDPAALRPAMLPARLGTAADNAFVARLARGSLRRPRAAPPARPLPVVFLSAAPFANFASTFLRGRQLSAMVAEAFPDYAVRFTEDAAGVRDAVVVLTKGAMEILDTEAIAALGRRNLATIGCWDDVRPEPDKARAVDAHMTLSHRQTLELNRLYPETPAWLVTHHVNRQVPAVTPPADRLRTGYFGDLGNTVRPASVAGMIDLVGTDTRNVNDSWLDALPRYNCHWIVRQTRSWDSWKPFLKGFVAARCGAPVIVVAGDGDAPHYLGDDYPFYARSLAAADLEMAMATAAAAFGAPDWDRARDIMAQVAARSTDAQVCAEFRLMVEEVIA